jgi:NAD(P)-dependent dehydrogenase (short-subunit alcohol dehydrogenase family)
VGTLKGQVALVTGASRGIGRDLALALGRAEHRVVATATEMAACQVVTAALRSERHEAEAVAFDLHDRGSIEAAMAAAVERLGRIDIEGRDEWLAAAGRRAPRGTRLGTQ